MGTRGRIIVRNVVKPMKMRMREREINRWNILNLLLGHPECGTIKE